MKIMVINGSPKGSDSNTMRLTRAFLDGIGESEVREITVATSKIAGCKGCFCCWNKTPGKCVISDDMQYVIDSEVWADVIIWSFPLYYFSVPGGLKNLIDRQLPMNLPFMTDRTDGKGSGSHPSRFDMSQKRHIVISTCGFYSAEKNYDSVKLLFDHMCGENYDIIMCGQGELFRVPELKSRSDEYLDIVRRAGEEFANGKIKEETREELSQLLYPKEVFEKMADASWGISEDGEGKTDETLSFTRQMAALYNKAAYDGKERVVEIVYTDKGKTYQIVLGKEKSEVFEGNDLIPTTRIETPWEVWLSIARDEIRGDEALMKGLYKVTGDFDLMIRWDEFFGSLSGNKEKNKASVQTQEKKKPSMAVLLIPWIVFWIAVSVNGQTGTVITLFVCCTMPLLAFRRKMTIYDAVTFCVVGILSAAAQLSGYTEVFVILGYLGFGLMWLLSCLTREPLCAAYVKYNYNGEDALKNPIFMKANYILAAAWGILYVIISVVTFFLYKNHLQIVSTVINNAAPILMGVFTAWFERWYPASVAAGKVK